MKQRGAKMKEIFVKSKKFPGNVILVSDEDYEDVSKFNIFFQSKVSENKILIVPTLFFNKKHLTLNRYIMRNEINDSRVYYKNGDQLDNRRENLEVRHNTVINIEKKVKVKTIQKRLPEHLRDVRVDRIMEKLKKNLKLTPGQYFEQMKKFCQTVLEIKHIEINRISLFSYWFQITKNEDRSYSLAMNDALPSSELLFYGNQLMNYSWSICNVYLDISASFWEEYDKLGNCSTKPMKNLGIVVLY